MPWFAVPIRTIFFTIKQAILIAMVFEFAGAYLAGGEVTSTIRKGIIDPTILSDQPELLVYGMMSSLLAAGIWLMIATAFGWPVSTTHSIIGAIVGFASVGISVDAVNWGRVGEIVSSWVDSILERCVSMPSMYPKQQRCDAAEYFYQLAPETVK